MCRGCRVFQCCCGCTDLKTGVLIWAIIDAIFVGIYTAYQIISLIGSVVSVGSSEIIVIGVASVVWGIIVLLADVGLAIGANKSRTDLMLAWLVVMMIQIIVIAGAIVLVRFSRHFFFQLCNVLNAIFFCRFL